MKLFRIPKGTAGKLITQEEYTDVKIQDWVTRKELTFVDVLLDPVRLHNQRSEHDHNSIAVKLVMQGYSLFGGVTGSDPSAKYFLAVPYDSVEVG